MRNKLLGTSALIGAAALGVCGLSPNDAAAQGRSCPASSLTGTGNVTNAICNATGTVVPFTLTINADVQELLQGDMGNKPTAKNGVAGNQGGPGNKDYGFFQDAWFRFGADAAGEGGTHYGFHFNLLTDSVQQTTVATKSGYSYTIAVNNSADHSPSQIDREYFYVRNPTWGQVQMGAGPTGATANFPYTLGPGGAGWGPPGPAIQTVGPDGGIISQALADPTMFGIDSSLSVLGADGYRDKATTHIRYISPNYFGSDSDHGFNLDVSFSPDGRGHDEGNFRTDSTGGFALNDLGWSNPPTQQFENLMNITDLELTWDDFVTKDIEAAAGAELIYGMAKGGGDASFAAAQGCAGFPCFGTYVPGGPNTLGEAQSSSKVMQDLTEVNTGASLIFGGALTVGADFTYAGKSMYPANTPAFEGPQDQPATCTAVAQATCKTGPTNPSWGMSYGIEYDWDRYQIGADYQYATGQGDFPDVGYIQLQYIEFGGSVQILKGLKVFSDFGVIQDRNNHSPGTITGGGCGDPNCRRNASGIVGIVGTSLDF